VGVFSSIKANWRALLTKYKEKNPKQAGITKVEFPRLLAELLTTANPGQHLEAAFNKCGLYPVNAARAVERIPAKTMECDTDTTRELMDSTFGDTLEKLRGFDKEKKKQPRGKKIKVLPGQSYSAEVDEQDDEEDEEDEIELDEMEVDELLEGMQDKEQEKDEEEVDRREERWRRTIRSIVESDSDQDYDEEEEVDRPKPAPEHAVGSFVVAVYDGNWFIAQVEAEEPENECEGFTLLKYMERHGNNQFSWGQKIDQLKTINTDILAKVDPPIPISSRHYGLPKDSVKKIETLFRVLWSIFYLKMLKGLSVRKDFLSNGNVGVRLIDTGTVRLNTEKGDKKKKGENF
jgi:hypothetical protein